MPSSGSLPAAFPSLGSAIAYCAYSFPDTLVCTTFRDYYMTLAVLNTIISTGLSCYSRYWPLPLRWDGAGASWAPPWTAGRGQRKRHLGAWDSSNTSFAGTQPVQPLRAPGSGELRTWFHALLWLS